jgi:hypothetical protein
MTTGTSQAHIQLTAAEPNVVGPLAVFPLISDTPPQLIYFSFAAAAQQGLLLTELAGGASVNDLVVQNPLDQPVLLYEGEEALGAQQNRTFDISILVAARGRLKVPVSCVEAGRWDGSRHEEAFTAAPQTANPRMRRMKADQVRRSAAAGGELRALQGEVWNEVQAAAGRHRVDSSTSAMHDVFEHHRGRLDAIADQVKLREGQVGMLVAIGGQFVVLDHVSEPAAFASLHSALVQGYALDALGAASVPPPSTDDARDFLRLLVRTPLRERPTPGLGEGRQFIFGGLAGSCLLVDDEIVTLTAFAGDLSPGGQAVAGHIRRPSRRRR